MSDWETSDVIYFFRKYGVRERFINFLQDNDYDGYKLSIEWEDVIDELGIEGEYTLEQIAEDWNHILMSSLSPTEYKDQIKAQQPVENDAVFDHNSVRMQCSKTIDVLQSSCLAELAYQLISLDPYLQLF